MTRWLALCLVLSGCTLTEEAVGGLDATLTLAQTVVKPGDSILAVVVGPNLDAAEVEVETEAVALLVSRVDGDLRLTLTVAPDAATGPLKVPLVLRSGQRRERLEAALTVVKVTLELSPRRVEALLGERSRVDIAASVVGASFDLVVHAPDLVAIDQANDALTVRPLGLCNPCTVQITLVVEQEVVGTAALEVVTVPRPTLSVTLSPTLLELRPGEQADLLITLDKVGLDKVHLAFADVDGLDVAYPAETTATEVAAVVVVARDASPGIVKLTLTADAEGLEAQAEAFVALEVSGD